MADGAINIGATERRVGGSNRGLRVSQVEEAGITDVIGVDAQQVMRRDIAKVVRRQHHPVTDFVLDADVHLYRSR